MKQVHGILSHGDAVGFIRRNLSRDLTFTSIVTPTYIAPFEEKSVVIASTDLGMHFFPLDEDGNLRRCIWSRALEFEDKQDIIEKLAAWLVINGMNVSAFPPMRIDEVTMFMYAIGDEL